MEIAPFENAGTYSLTIIIEKDAYRPQTIQVDAKVLKRSVAVPTAKSDLRYNGLQ